ncbi:MAG TPA: hypothetical protein VFQ04_03145, partial [Actinomycetes bacterium]|nr:hypothetical protein [Actinomycetes bacterium]
MLPGILDTMAPDRTEGTDAATSMTVRHGAEPAGSRRWPAALAWVLAGLAVLSGVPSIRLQSLVWFEGSPEAAPTLATIGPVILAVVSAVTVGALVAGRRPRHPVGWLLLGVGLAVAVNVLVEPYVKYGLLVRPGSLPAARHLVGIVYSPLIVALSCAGFVLLLTPTGSLPSPRWRWWARVAAAAPVLTVVGFAVQPDPMAPDYLGNPLAVPALAPALLVAALAGALVVLVGLLAGAGSLVLRFRRARGVERLQLRWLALAAACASVLLVVGLVAGGLGRDPVVLASLALCLALLPLATGAAILRYRLYDLDRIVSRTVAYGLLTVVGFAVQPDPMAPEYLGNPLAVPTLAPALLVAALAGVLVVVVGLLVGAGSLVLRFRRARGVERLQLRWLALAAACASVLLVVGLVAGGLGRDPVVLASL